MIKDFILLVLALVLIFGIIYNALGTPEVVFSWSTGECLEVNYMDGTKGDCDNLPEKYDHVWGK